MTIFLQKSNNFRIFDGFTKISSSPNVIFSKFFEKFPA